MFRFFSSISILEAAHVGPTSAVGETEFFHFSLFEESFREFFATSVVISFKYKKLRLSNGAFLFYASYVY